MKNVFKIVFVVLTVFSFAGLHAFWWGSDNKDEPAAEEQVERSENIVEIASQQGDFKTLVTALQAADLTGILEGPGPFTVFAPTNEAFDKLGKDKLNELMKPENKEELREILLYHVVPGKMMAGDLQSMSVPTANGEDLEIKVEGSQVTVDGVQVTKPDLVGSNGVIHVIDAVLVPEQAGQ